MLTPKMDYKPTNLFPSLSRPVLPMFSTSISLHSLMSEHAQIMQQTFFVQLYFVRNTREELLSFLLAKEISPCSIEKSVGNNCNFFTQDTVKLAIDVQSVNVHEDPFPIGGKEISPWR